MVGVGVGVGWVLTDPVMGKETVLFQAESKSKLLLLINTEKHGSRGNYRISIFIEIQFPWRERLRLEHL